jgi:hypothetical protein
LALYRRAIFYAWIVDCFYFKSMEISLMISSSFWVNRGPSQVCSSLSDLITLSIWHVVHFRGMCGHYFSKCVSIASSDAKVAPQSSGHDGACIDREAV